MHMESNTLGLETFLIWNADCALRANVAACVLFSTNTVLLHFL